MKLLPKKIKFQISEETRYYLRDLAVFSFTIIVSVLFAELFFFDSEEQLGFSGKFDTYLFIILPFLAASLFASYSYRNRRNRETGKIRSSIRYRLILAFLFVALLPSLPVFLLTSSLSAKLVERFYQIEVGQILEASGKLLSKEEQRETEKLLNESKEFRKELKDFQSGKPDSIAPILDKIYSFEFGVWSNEEKLFSNQRFDLVPSKLKWETIGKNEKFLFCQNGNCFILIKTNLSDTMTLIISKQVYFGFENLASLIREAKESYLNSNLWKEKIPLGIRYTVGLFAVLMFTLAIVFSFLFAKRLSEPIIQLANATKEVSLGKSDVKIAKTEEGEMGILIDSFNQMVADLKSKNEELMHTQRIAAWKEVAQRMAHEIKNPLTPIQLSAERLRRKWDSRTSDEVFSPILKDATDTIIGQVRVLELLVKEFSEFARMPVPVLINQNLNPIIEECLNLFKDTTEIEFETKLALNLPELFLDKRLFTGVINNLIKNAVEAIQSQDIEESTRKKKKIKVVTKLVRKALQRSVQIEIEDSGPGLPLNLREKIFEPYFSTKEKHGSGIGLAIVQKTVIDHHGHITVEESKFGGCRFKIELPVVQ